MSTFPLVRTRWSNEHIMAALFAVLVLYQIPAWIDMPVSVLGFLVVLASGLLLDVVINFIRYKKPICAVSAAVTAGLIQIMAPGVPLWGRLAAVAAALILGKHVWGGTGKNGINPAVTGLVLLALFFDIQPAILPATVFVLPAIVLSIPFILFRPYAGIGMMMGMALMLFFKGELNFWNSISYGVILWSCLIITDPTTVTPKPIIGGLGGFLTGFLPLYLTGSFMSMALTLLAFNLVSYGIECSDFEAKLIGRDVLKLKKICSNADGPALNELSYDLDNPVLESNMSAEEILRRIDKNGVYGFGGAAFSTSKKIETVMKGNNTDKYLIINGVECDPGLVHDYWLMRNFSDQIAKAAELLVKAIPFKRIYLAVKEDKDLIFQSPVEVIKVKDYYPSGAEKNLISQVLGITLEVRQIPAQQGILVLNVQTMLAIYEAVYLDKRADEKYITVVNRKDNLCRVEKVRLGARIQDIAESIGSSRGPAFYGGGAMQCRRAEDEDIIEDTTNFIAVSDFPRYKESVLCSKCGFCEAHCPAGLMVSRIVDLVDEGLLQEAEKYHAEKCINCGSCSYVCLAGRNLAARVQSAKGYIRDMERQGNL